MWLRAMRLCVTLAIGCVVGINIPDDGLLSDDFLQMEMASGKTNEELKTELQKKMRAVSELHLEAQDLKAERTAERSKKAQKAVDYMESYAGRKVTQKKKISDLRAQMANDNLLILRTADADEQGNELRKKHDGRIKKTMKRALTAMRKVDHLVRGHQRTDPTVKSAEKAVVRARGSEIFTVLGLDYNQLNKDYLLSLDAAVAAYNAMPDANSEEKMEKALEVTKERVRKEKIIEMKKKKEVKAKKERSDQNAAYYKQKWVEKTRELHRKKTARDKYVSKIKSEYKFKRWIQEQKENESSHKKSKFDQESAQKIKVEKDHKAFRVKVAAANAKIKENREKKFDAEQKTLQDKLTSAKNDYEKKKSEAYTAGEARQATRTKMTTIRLNSQAATEKSDEANKKFGYAEEMKTKFASESNQKASADKRAVRDAAKQTAKESEFKLKEILTVMDERDGKQSKAKLAVREALKVQEAAKEQADMHAAKRDEVVKEEPPPKVDDVADQNGNIDPNVMMKKQMEAMGRVLSSPNKQFKEPSLSLASKSVQNGAGTPPIQGKSTPLQQISPETGNPKP